MNNVLSRSFRAISIISLFILCLAAATTASASMKILYYNDYQQSVAIGEIDEQNNHNTIASYDPASFSLWTHIVEHASDIFYYNQWTGAAALGSVDIVGVCLECVQKITSRAK
jgi:hypothetical protein